MLEQELCTAAENGDVDRVRHLLENGANISATDNRTLGGETPLLIAIENGHEAVIVLLLLEHHANVNQAGNYGQTPLFMASRKGHEAMVQLLLEHNANINQATIERETPLYTASQHGHGAVVRLFAGP
jgi:ankyrin repeat protein